MSYLVCKSVCLFISYLLVRSVAHMFNVIYIKSISLINISDIIIIETIFSLSNFDSYSIFILISFNLFVCLFYYLL